MKTLAQDINITITRLNGEITRPVSILKEDDGIIFGSVGQAKFYWRPQQNPLPLVIIKGRRFVNSKECKLVKMFLETWRKAMSENKKTVACFQEREKGKAEAIARQVAKKGLNYISGHPFWLTTEKKRVLCRVKATGKIYYSRRIIPEKMKELIKSHVEKYCYCCQYRSGCTEPCSIPEINSAEDVIYA